MQLEVTLTLTDEMARARRVVVQSKRFTIGRSPDNDLAISDSNLSRRHAVIETLNGFVQISDCGSQNGTMVNGEPIIGAVELRDGDVITLGGACDIAVGLCSGDARLAVAARPASSAQQATADQAWSTNAPVVAAAAPSTPPWLSPPVIAGAAIALILLIAAGILVAISMSDDTGKAPLKKNVNSGYVNRNDEDYGKVIRPGPLIKLTPDPTPSVKASETPPVTDTTEQIERAVKRTMRRISNDSAPYISRAGINDVAEKVEGYRGSSALREKLHAVKRNCPELNAQARDINLKPALLMYAALAESEGGRDDTDPVAVARQMMPKLLTLQASFGTGTANSSLLVIAAYHYPFNPPIGSQKRTPHPLDSKLRELGRRHPTADPSEVRSVWFLREKKEISDEAYDLVIRLLAIGIIAQDPSRYGIAADSLLC